MVRLQDEPIADPVCVPVYYVSKLARDNGVIVCQVGEGADELFWGYPSVEDVYCSLQRYDDLPVPPAAEASRVAAATAAAGQGRTARGTSCCAAAPTGQPIFWGGAEAFTRRAEAAAAVAAAAPRARRAHLVGRDRADPRALRRARPGSRRHLNWMTLCRPEPAAARAAADARRQDEHGRQPRRARAVPRPQVRRARDGHPGAT